MWKQKKLIEPKARLILNKILKSMKYYFLQEQFEKGMPFLYGELIAFEEAKESIRIGSPLPGKSSELVFYTNKKKHKDYFSDGSFVIVSHQCKDLFTSFTLNSVIYYEVGLRKKGEITDFATYYLPLFPVLSCFDYEQSDYRGIKEEKYISRIRNMILDESSIKGHHIFRFKEIPSLVLVSEALKDAVKKSGRIGLKFIPIEDFKYPIMP